MSVVVRGQLIILTNFAVPLKCMQTPSFLLFGVILLALCLARWSANSALINLPDEFDGASGS